MLDQPEFGQRLKQLRIQRGLSQAALADGFLSTSYLSRLESGARPPTRRIVKQLAERLAVAESDFGDASPDTAALATLVAVVASSGTAATGPAPGGDTGGVDDVVVAGAASLGAPSGEVPASAGAARQVAEELAAALDSEGADPALRWQALWLLAHTRRAQRQTEDELRLFTESVDLADGLDVPELRVRSRSELARTLAATGDLAGARRTAEQALALSEEGVGALDRLAALHALVAAEVEGGRLAEAREHVDELCRTAAGCGMVERVKAQWAAAAVRTRQADYAGARQLLESALDELDSWADPVLWLRLRLAAASLYLQAAEPLLGPARARLAEAERAVDLVGSVLHRDQLRALQARLAYAEGRYAEARELAGRDEAPLRRLSFRDGVRLQSLRAQLLMRAGEVEQGTVALQELARQAQEALNVDLAAEIWRDLAWTVAALHATPAA